MDQNSGATIHCENVPWLPLAPGIGIRLLRLDADSGAFTVMIRGEPGAVLPRHRHLELSEIYIIRGTGTHPQTGYFQAGDYVCEQKGAIHDLLPFGEETVLFMVNQGPSAFLNDDDSVAFIMDVAMLEQLAAAQRR